MKTTAKREIVIKAIINVNKKHGYKIELNRDDVNGRWYSFTLKSKSGIKGSRISPSGRNLACASWHAHGYIFDEIFNLNPEVVIHSAGNKISKGDGNWIDYNIGSTMNPLLFF